MRLESPPHILDLRIAEVGSEPASAAGDLCLKVMASIGGFSGAGTCWVEAGAIEAFRGAVRGLYDSFQGRAELKSMSPGEFSLSFSPASPRGYIRVQVAIAKIGLVKCSMGGEFEVELAALFHVMNWLEEPSVDA